MKKFLKVATLILIMVISFSFLLVGCKKDDDNYIGPSASDRVYGNGGLAVTKGDYLYFLNGYKSYETVSESSDNTSVVRGAIYRTKLTNVGDLQFNYDEDGEIVDVTVEKVVDRIACFENGGIYIIGNYLYYTTPNTQDNSSGQILNNYVNYCRVPLNSATSEEVLYTSKGAVTSGDWAVYEMNGGIYMVINSGSTLVCVKDGDKKNVVTMAESITGAKLWTNENNHTLSSQEQYIYYTRDLTDDDSSTSGNILARVKIGTNNEEIIKSDNSNTYTLFDVKNNNIYYTKSSEENGLFYFNASTYKEGNQLLFTTYDNKYVIDNYGETTLNRVVVYTASTDSESANGKLSFFDNGTVNENIVLENVDITILGVAGNYVYYVSNSIIYRVNILNSKSSTDSTKPETLINGDSEFNFSATQTMAFDVDVNYLYILNGYTVDSNTNYYTERISLSNPTTHTFIGAFANGEKPVEDEE